MINSIANWWRSQQFKSAVKRGDIKLAIKVLEEIQKAGAKLSWLERLFREKLQSEQYLQQYKQEAGSLNIKLKEALNKLEFLDVQEVFDESVDVIKPDDEFIKFVYKTFNLIQHDEHKLQCTGIDERIFDDFEARLVEYLKEEFKKISEKHLKVKLEDALEDINTLKIGQDPDYRFSLTPHVYFMKYFLENVYCLYLAWFLIYKAGLLPQKVNILDIAAGPGTVGYGLALFLQSMSGFFQIPQIHISYYSLEKQDAFQFRGLQFWRKYIESRKTPINTFFRFVTEDIFNWKPHSSNIPNNFFDFIVISHCFFNIPARSLEANKIYKQIIDSSLKQSGYVLLIVQDKKLFKAYNAYQSEDHIQEQKIVNMFVSDLGLDLVWYQYLTSTGLRTIIKSAEFGKFAREKLPKKIYMSPLIHHYFNQKYDQHYTLDDYVILAQMKSR
ncbi:MAG: photosystem II assembly protein [Nostocaceae cyanobacterium]|nr:photosystem II assembly protein [Nostocaceae cyanobacterium]